MTTKELEKLRGNRISMIFQDPGSSLNPVMRVGDQVSEIFQIHLNISKQEGRKKALEMLKQVEIPDPESRMLAFPHELSGGMAQRIMIAIALACNPDILIADEPTTALDVTIQAQILELMQSLSRDFGTAQIIITHNLGVVARYADRVIVMYAGKIIETSSSLEIYENPLHPYTVGLLNSVPRIDATDETRERLEAIEGAPPNLGNRPSGCGFMSNCAGDYPECVEAEPVLRELKENHWIALCSHCEEEHGCKWFPRDD
jgi:oligopeptide/dipeptide ABC transporter ATP-binding protein